MLYDEFEHLRLHHPAWTLLRSPHAPLILGFVARVFVDLNAGSRSASDLSGELEDEIIALNERLGGGTFPRSAQEYLDEWAAPDKGWLRKFYPPTGDEPHYDLAPSVEKALFWVRELRSREFVGTESRLNIIFDLLQQMVLGADADPQRRLADLKKRRVELDQEIARAERGDVSMLDSAGQRDRYQQFSRMARELLGDFREVEENFRTLDRNLRERIAGWEGSKGELLDDVLGSRHSIAESDQGRSFQAFYDFLLSYQRQQELTELLEQLQNIDGIPERERSTSRIHFEWIDASERTQATVRLLSEQLRRFLDDQVWLENRRVFDLLRNIEKRALDVRNNPPTFTIEMDDIGTSVTLPFERPLFTPPLHTALDTNPVQAGDANFDTSKLHEQLFVDRAALARTIRRSLQEHSQVALDKVIATTPLQRGLAELIGYLSLDDPAFSIVFDDENRTHINWSSGDVDRLAELPQVTYTKDSDH